jgi:hypothetical protein
MGRPRRKWEDNIRMDLQEVGGGRGDWMELAQDRDRYCLIALLEDGFIGNTVIIHAPIASS